MIQINLLPVREARRQANLRQQAMLLGVAAAFGALVCVWLQLSISSAVAQEERQIAQARVELKALDATRKEVERFRQEKEEIEKKLGVINTLEQSRQGPVRIMDEIATRIPKRIWLSQMRLSKGVIELKGTSLDAEIVAAFLASLAESEMFREIELDETRLSEIDGLKLNTFSIRGRYGNKEFFEQQNSQPKRKQGRNRK